MIPRHLRSSPGSRFAIRPYEPRDTPALYQAADESRAHVGQWMSWMTDDYSIEHTEHWVRHAVTAWDEGTDYEFVIIDQMDGVIAGSCGLNELSPRYLMCNLGYWVRTTRCRLGAARQAAQLLRDFGIHELGLNRLEIVVATGNLPSQRAARAAGALHEGILHQRIHLHGTTHDAEMFALLRAPVKT